MYYVLHCQWQSKISNTVGIEADSEDDAINKLYENINVEDLPEFEILAIHTLAAMAPDSEVVLQ